jgi:serpin B
MKKGILSIFMACLIVAVIFTTGCVEDDDGKKKDIPPTQDVVYVGKNDYINSSNEFTFEMYMDLINGDDDIFFSPYSIVTALGMAYEGARGQTASEMEDVFDFIKNNKTRWEMVRSVQSMINQNNPSYELSTANAYWLRLGEELNNEYKNAIESYYLAHGEELNFRGDPEGSADTINEWVEQKTNDKIKDLIAPGIITVNTYLILTNAIYFKSDWKYQFDPDATEDMTFYKSSSVEKLTPMMHMKDEEIELNYSSNEDAHLLMLPYQDEELSMYILLPKENNISSLESKLNKEYLDNMKEDLSPEYIDLYLPKFKFELKYNLNKNLIDMGMPSAFEPSNANFSGIKASSGKLWISKVIHQSFVEVNEEGTEAAAATAVVMEDYAGGPSEPVPIEFKADHPFIFFIEHKETGQILFMGKVENP